MKKIRLSEAMLRNIVKESVKNVLSEINWKTYADAASAAKDRENIFKDAPGYPDTPMRKSYDENGKLDNKKFERDTIHQRNQSRQPETFRKAAYNGLSKEVCGEEDFVKFLVKYVQENGFDDKAKAMVQQYADGDSYIKNNKTKWSKRNQPIKE